MTAAHIPALDGVRGVAILLVMTFHFEGAARTLFGADSSPAPPDLAARAIAGIGWSGVDLFFVLSGFLITGILYDMKGAGRFSSFYARRALRIFPLYYAFLVSLFVVVPLFGLSTFEAPVAGHIWYWFYAPDLGMAFGRDTYALMHGAASHLWSLSVEEQFYLLWPAVVLPLNRRPLMLICAGCVAGALAFRSGVRFLGLDPALAYHLLPARLDTLAMGALLALAARSTVDLVHVLRWARPAGAVAVVVVGTLVLVRMTPNSGDAWIQTVGYTALALLFGAIVITAASSGNLPILEQPWLRLFGRYSYGLYVVHTPLVLLLQWRVAAAGSLPELAGMQLPATLAFILAATLMSLGAASLSWHFYERWFLGFKSRFPYARHRAVAELPPRAVQEATPLA